MNASSVLNTLTNQVSGFLGEYLQKFIAVILETFLFLQQHLTPSPQESFKCNIPARRPSAASTIRLAPSFRHPIPRPIRTAARHGAVTRISVNPLHAALIVTAVPPQSAITTSSHSTAPPSPACHSLLRRPPRGQPSLPACRESSLNPAKLS